MTGHEAVNAAETRELLRTVPPFGSVLIASDLADPAQGNKRAGRAFYLSNAYGHQFWLSQTVYGLDRIPETEWRRQSLERFFSEKWSSWHTDLLWDNGVSHVLISERCPSLWDPSHVPMLEHIATTASWSLWKVAPRSEVWNFAIPEVEQTHDNSRTAKPTFGRGACH
jgi:hypothetical protein